MASTFVGLLHEEIRRLLPTAEIASVHEVMNCSLFTRVRVGDRQVRLSLTHYEILAADGGNGWLQLAQSAAARLRKMLDE